MAADAPPVVDQEAVAHRGGFYPARLRLRSSAHFERLKPRGHLAVVSARRPDAPPGQRAHRRRPRAARGAGRRRPSRSAPAPVAAARRTVTPSWAVAWSAARKPGEEDGNQVLRRSGVRGRSPAHADPSVHLEGLDRNRHRLRQSPDQNRPSRYAHRRRHGGLAGDAEPYERDVKRTPSAASLPARKSSSTARGQGGKKLSISRTRSTENVPGRPAARPMSTGTSRQSSQAARSARVVIVGRDWSIADLDAYPVRGSRLCWSACRGRRVVRLLFRPWRAGTRTLRGQPEQVAPSRDQHDGSPRIAGARKSVAGWTPTGAVRRCVGGLCRVGGGFRDPMPARHTCMPLW